MKRLARGKPVIGILGGIGAGKTTVAAELAKLGCAVVDGDAIGHELLDRRDVRAQVRRRWGPAVFTPKGRVSRRALAAVVFRDPAELAALNAILHPLIRQRIKRQIAELRAKASVAAVVLDAAVMMEAGWDKLCTHRVFVKAPRGRRLRRKQRERSPGQVPWKRREEFQIPLDKKAAACDYIMDNSSGVSCLRNQVREFFLEIVHAADPHQQQ